jgi:ribonuclease HI
MDSEINFMSTQSLKKIKIYTDGACKSNPGPGGYGIVMLYENLRKELSGGFSLTTNNRMEMMAAIVALETLKTKCDVTLYSDSQYLINAINKGWAIRWQQNNWKRNKSELAENIDLWERLLPLCKKHKLTFEWVRGHAGNTENERCDYLSSTKAKEKNLPADEGYIKNK